ncbi:MAG: leucyl aminopeptidase [Planctomycetes bacterium]|nr:leucyl aminopeptidase [Planctomycetota bacterium]MCB9935328.1 leucyl aminopeptidase [Planctomycetota bacterium]
MQFAYADNSATVKADALLVPVYEGGKGLKDYKYGDKLAKLFKKGDFEGKAGSSLMLHKSDGVAADRVFLLGLGKKDKDGASQLGEALAGFFRNGSIHSYKLKHVAVALEGIHDDAQAIGRWCAEGALLGDYHFDVLFSKKDKKKHHASKVTLAGGKAAELKKGVAYGEVTAEYTAHARDLVNEPSNRINPATLAKFAQDMAKKVPGLKCTILHKPEIEKLKMGAFLGVNAGSDIPAHLIVLEWKGGKQGEKPIAYVGKGLCFDSGGYDIKPAAGMLGMKMDMGGGAATICALGAIGKLKLKVNAVGVVPATENLINGKAYHPGSVLTSMSGQTIEIGNTDAEGRLILCDALTYTQQKFKPRVVVDMATLTGAQVVALGGKVVGLMSNDDKVAKGLESAFKAVHEEVWRLPLPEFYDKQLDSTIADMQNIGGNPGTVTAGLFLQRFIDKGQKWAHLDIAGPAMNDGDGWRLWSKKSATGAPVRSLVEFAENYK